jgi:hypothetical protein
MRMEGKERIDILNITGRALEASRESTRERVGRRLDSTRSRSVGCTVETHGRLTVPHSPAHCRSRTTRITAKRAMRMRVVPSLVCDLLFLLLLLSC